MHLIALKVKLDIEDKAVQYLKMNEIDSLNIGGGNFFVLTDRQPNEVEEMCKKYFKLCGIKLVKNLVIASPLLNFNFSKVEFNRLKETYEVR